MCMYNGSAEAKTLEAVVSGGRGIYRIEDKTGVSFDFEEHMIRNRREYCYDLDLLTLGPDKRDCCGYDQRSDDACYGQEEYI